MKEDRAEIASSIKDHCLVHLEPSPLAERTCTRGQKPNDSATALKEAHDARPGTKIDAEAPHSSKLYPAKARLDNRHHLAHNAIAATRVRNHAGQNASEDRRCLGEGFATGSGCPSSDRKGGFYADNG